jgi:hypothetical protein
MTALLIIAAAITGYALFVLASPVTGCRKCLGFGTSGRRRRRPCGRCAGTGIRFRPGAPLLYRTISGYRRHRANGNLTPPPLRPPRRHP